jgi:hypothetical protein
MSTYIGDRRRSAPGLTGEKVAEDDPQAEAVGGERDPVEPLPQPFVM